MANFPIEIMVKLTYNICEVILWRNFVWNVGKSYINDSEQEYIISKELDFCEGCGQLKKVIIKKRDEYFWSKFFSFIF